MGNDRPYFKLFTGAASAVVTHLLWNAYRAAAAADFDLANSVWTEIASQAYIYGLVLSACQITGWWQIGRGAIASHLGITIGRILKGEDEARTFVLMPMAILAWLWYLPPDGAY